MAVQFLECKSTYIASATTTTIESLNRNIYIHTVTCPIATTGTVTFQDVTTPTTYFVLPIGSIGSFVIDAKYPNGLAVVTSAADKVIVTTMQ